MKFENPMTFVDKRLADFEQKVGGFPKRSRGWLLKRVKSRWFPRDLAVAAEFISQRVGTEPFYLFGAGTHTIGLLELLQGTQLLNQLLGVLDGHPQPGQAIAGFQVYSATHALGNHSGKIILSHAEFEDGMRQDLLSLGIDEERIVPIYLDGAYGQLVQKKLSLQIDQQLESVPARGGKKRIVFVSARERCIFDENIIRHLQSLGTFQLIQVKMDRLESLEKNSSFDMTLNAQNGLSLCLEIVERLEPDLIYVQEHYSSGNFLPLIPALSFSNIPVIGEFYDFLGLIFDDPYILSRESYWRTEDVDLGMDAERWCIDNLSGIVTKESGQLLHEYLAGANYLEVQPQLPRSSFVERQAELGKPLRLVWAGAIAPSHLSAAIIGNNQLLDVFTELVELGFDVTAYSSCPDWAALESHYADYLKLAERGNFRILPRIPQQNLIKQLAEEFDYGIAFGRLKKGHQQGLSNKITVSGKIFTYAAAGLPMLVADYYEVMGTWVSEHNLGLLVDPDNLQRLPAMLTAHDHRATVKSIYRYRQQHNFDALLTDVADFIEDISPRDIVEDPNP